MKKGRTIFLPLDELIEEKRKRPPIERPMTSIPAAPLKRLAPPPPPSTAETMPVKKKQKVDLKESPAPPPPPIRLPKTLSDDEIRHINRGREGPWIHNVVATVSLGFRPEVHSLAWKVGGMHNIHGFSAPFTQRTCDPTCTVLVFERGSCVITGCSSPEVARLQLWRYARMLRDFGYPCMPSEFRVYNMQGTGRLGYTVDCAALHAALPGSEFCPIEFNALKYETTDPKVTYRIFDTGSLVITGARDRHVISRAFEHILPIVAHFKVREISATELRREKERMYIVRRYMLACQRLQLRQSNVRAKLLRNAVTQKAKLSKVDLMLLKGVREIHVQPECKYEGRTNCVHVVHLTYPGSLIVYPLGPTDGISIAVLHLNNQQPVPKHFESFTVAAQAQIKPIQVKLEPTPPADLKIH